MIGIYIIIALFIAGIIALVIFKQKWARADKKEVNRRANNIEDERIQELVKVEAREIAKKTAESRSEA